MKCDELFEKLYLANEKQPFLTLSNRTSDYGINGIEAKLPLYIEQVLSYSGSTYYSDGLGIGSLKSEGNDLDTRNLLRTQYFEDVMKAWKRYSEKGYVNENMDEKALVELCNSYTPEIIFENAEGDYVIPMSRHYVLNMYKPLSGVKPFSGIGSGSTRQELAFEALTDFVEDLELNILIQGIGLEAKGAKCIWICISFRTFQRRRKRILQSNRKCTKVCNGTYI